MDEQLPTLEQLRGGQLITEAGQFGFFAQGLFPLGIEPAVA